MTVSTTTVRKSYTGDGSTTAFPTTFPFYDDDDLVVIERVIATGVETTKTKTTDYSVSGGNGSTGTVTAVSAPANTVEWHITRDTPDTQSIDYDTYDDFPAAQHEEGLDRAALRDQEHTEALGRSLRFPRTDSLSLSAELPNSVDRASKLLGFDENGAPQEMSQLDDTIAIASQAQMEAATDPNSVVTPGRIKYSPHAAKGEGSVTYSGGTPTLERSTNVASIVDNGVGALQVRWDAHFSDADYACVATAESNSGATPLVTFIEAAGQSTSAVILRCANLAGSATDPNRINFSAYGDQ